MPLGKTRPQEAVGPWAVGSGVAAEASRYKRERKTIIPGDLIDKFSKVIQDGPLLVINGVK